MERSKEIQSVYKSVLPLPKGSERFSIKEAIKWGAILGLLGIAAGFSLVAASANFYEVSLYSKLMAPLTLGLGFGAFGFAGGGLLGRTRK